MIHIQSLHQRITLFLILPVAVLLLAMGAVAFGYARNALLNQWTEATILRLQRAAHHVDMRLDAPKKWMRMFQEAAKEPDGQYLRSAILHQIRAVEGVSDVRLMPAVSGSSGNGGECAGTGGRQPFLCTVSYRKTRTGDAVTFDADAGAKNETVTLVSDLSDDQGRPKTCLAVDLRFSYLADAVAASGWWQRHRAYLVDEAGTVLTGNHADLPPRIGDDGNPLEQAVLAAMTSKNFGTVFGEGHPPAEIGGFYRLMEAPWVLVIFAPGDEILAPLLRFRWYFAVTGSVFILVILVLIRWVTGRTASAVRNVSEAAKEITEGRFGGRLPVTGLDEVGELTRSFNTMTRQLEERSRLKNALNLAMEVQQNLLPSHDIRFHGLDIAGRSLYCDETGGDYYDFFENIGGHDHRIGIAVGDVAGHGVSAALLMTTVRALIRSRIARPGALSSVVTDVNRLLCRDTGATGNFMSLFFMTLDPPAGEIRWVRAGHDPAFVYSPRQDAFTELNGEGIVLGMDDAWDFREQVMTGWTKDQLILVGTDGIWETENPAEEMFGKERLRRILRRCHERPAAVVLQDIVDALSRFREGARQKDDITLVLIKKQVHAKKLHTGCE
jgi:sigma-B regulation protein RsbU (phosphoserine phosphatase)